MHASVIPTPHKSDENYLDRCCYYVIVINERNELAQVHFTLRIEN